MKKVSSDFGAQKLHLVPRTKFQPKIVRRRKLGKTTNFIGETTWVPANEIGTTCNNFLSM